MGMNEYTKKLTLNQKSQISYVKTITKNNIWYYRDRLNIARGPCDIHILRKCWIDGIIDQNTLVWGQGLDSWLPLKNISTLILQIRLPEVQIATFIKKNFVIKPNINEIRKRNKNRRSMWTNQIDFMY